MLSRSDKQKIQSLASKPHYCCNSREGRCSQTLTQVCAAFGVYWVVYSLQHSGSFKTQRIRRPRALQTVGILRVETIESHEITEVTEAVIFGNYRGVNTVIFAKCRNFAVIFRVFVIIHEYLHNI